MNSENEFLTKTTPLLMKKLTNLTHLSTPPQKNTPTGNSEKPHGKVSEDIPQ
jgi:hypothetical protein